MILKQLKKIDRTLVGLMLGILLWALLWQVIGIWFVPDKGKCSLGLWIGTVLAEGAALHMFFSLESALGRSEKDAQKLMITHNIVRYIIIALVLGTLMLTGWGNPLTAFLGLIGLKVSAFMQPFTDKFFYKNRKIRR